MIRRLLFALLLTALPQVGGMGVLTRAGGGAAVCPGATVACYPMNEGTGAIFHDLSGNHNDVTVGTPANITWGTTTMFGGLINAPTFNGSVAGAVAGSVGLTNFNGTVPFSVSVWYENESCVAAPFVVSTINPSVNSQGWGLAFTQNGPQCEVQFLIINNYPGNAINTVYGFDGEENGAHNFIETYDGSGHAAGVTMYQDGIQRIYNVTYDSLTAPASSGLALSIGGMSASNPASTTAADVRVYARALTQAEVSAIFTAGPL
jgi:Concanavalin A-like lectin/glucanases superfamily